MTRIACLEALYLLLPHSGYLEPLGKCCQRRHTVSSLLKCCVLGFQVMCKPGTVTPHKKFEAEIYALNKEEGGRHKPFFSNYKPQFYFRTADITGACREPRCDQLLFYVTEFRDFPWLLFPCTQLHHIKIIFSLSLGDEPLVVADPTCAFALHPSVSTCWAC